MLIYEYKLDGSKAHYAAIEEAIRIVQFIRNTCLRLWMDEHANKNELQCSCAVLAKAYSFVSCLNSQARQASADRAWSAIARFYTFSFSIAMTSSVVAVSPSRGNIRSTLFWWA
ncbi:hypothetical protein KSC_109470 [Ktedonobacter sp. SOSP1-52]|nr:hypothetical protein KSC_109470 [Ktedonobacter sp. SOSP1-52]